MISQIVNGDPADPHSGVVNESSPLYDWLNAQGYSTKEVITALVRLFTDGVDAIDLNGDRFIAQETGVSRTRDLHLEKVDLSETDRISTGLAAMEFADELPHVTGPGGTDPGPATWDLITVADDEFVEVPATVTLVFPVGTLSSSSPVAIRFTGRDEFAGRPRLSVYTCTSRADSREILETLKRRGAELNPLRGRFLRTRIEDGLSFSVATTPVETFDDVVLPEAAVAEIMLNVNAVSRDYERLTSMGLGGHRGVMVVGHPGVGKTMMSRAVISRLAGDFTCIEVSAKVGTHYMTQVVEEAKLLAPAVLVLNDIDLWVGARSDRRSWASGSTEGLSQLLDALDAASDSQVLTIATSNDPEGLKDAAAIRNGRFDSLVFVDYPDRAASAEIFRRHLRGCGDDVDTVKVAQALPERTSGADIREIVRRSVMTADGEVLTTEIVLEVIRSRKWRPDTENTGQYL